MKLSNATLAAVPPTVARPAYDRDALRPGIVHIGRGNFHRAHMAVYLDDLFAKGLGLDWAILEAGVRAADGAMREALAAQDYLSAVIELAPGALKARVIGATVGFAAVGPGNAALIATMTAPSIRIVSLTVTEGGYYIDPKTGTFSPDHPDIRHDAKAPDASYTAFGAIVAALAARRAKGIAAFTVMCCDNVPHNGVVTRDAVVGLARLSNPALADWINDNVAFPNSMVDCITAATGARERALAARLGVDDVAPVTCEPFRHWVIEDSFPAGRPPLEAVGVTFTAQVGRFEAMKIRILNGGHALIAYPAGLAGIELVHEAMADRQIRDFLDAVLTREVLPIVPPVPAVRLPDYKAQAIVRFANPEVADTVRRLCLDGSNRQPKFIIPSIRDSLAAGRDASGSILLSALWCRYCAGTTEAGTAIEPNDPTWDRLHARAMAVREHPAQWLAMAEVYGDLAQETRLVAEFTAALNAAWQHGSRAAMAACLARTSKG